MKLFYVYYKIKNISYFINQGFFQKKRRDTYIKEVKEKLYIFSPCRKSTVRLDWVISK